MADARTCFLLLSCTLGEERQPNSYNHRCHGVRFGIHGRESNVTLARGSQHTRRFPNVASGFFMYSWSGAASRKLQSQTPWYAVQCSPAKLHRPLRTLKSIRRVLETCFLLASCTLGEERQPNNFKQTTIMSSSEFTFQITLPPSRLEASPVAPEHRLRHSSCTVQAAQFHASSSHNCHGERFGVRPQK